MNWASWAPTIVAIVTAIFVTGQVTGRIKDQEKALDGHEQRLDGHDLKLENHALELVKINAFNEGYKAGMSKGHVVPRS